MPTDQTQQPEQPKRKVVRVDPSPMNRKVKIAELDCGHDLYIHPPQRAPKVGAERECEKCRP